MSLLTSLKSEFIKTKRSRTWILTIIMAAVAPLLVPLVLDLGDPSNAKQIKEVAQDPWNQFFHQGRLIISIVFLPIFVVFMGTLLPQIEYRYHTWKQVMASPQTFAKLYFAKYIVFQTFIITFLVVNTLAMALVCIIFNTIYPEFKFFSHQLDMQLYGTMIIETYISILALSTLQFWMGIRFKNFLLPIGVGIILSILGMINLIGYKIIDPDKFLFNFPAFIAFNGNAERIPFVMWISCAYAATFLVVGFIDFRHKKFE